MLPTRAKAAALPASEQAQRGNPLYSLLILSIMLLMLSGIIGFFGSDLIVDPLAGLFGHKPHLIERPIGDLKAVKLDQRGQIYTFDGAYMRVQHYDSQGRFISSWKVPFAYKGGPNWKIDQNNTLHLLALNNHLSLDATKGFQQAKGSFEVLKDTAPELPWQLKIHRPVLLPTISKVTPEGEVPLVVSKFQVFGIMAGPLFGWLVVLAGALILTLLHKLENKTSPVQFFGITFKA